jgi:hypothetical protein
LILRESQDDWVALWSVLSAVRAAYGENLSKERSRELTLMAVERLLSTGRIEAGWPTAQGEWEPWRMSTRAVLTRIESEWSALNDEPNIGAEIVWFNPVMKPSSSS